MKTRSMKRIYIVILLLVILANSCKKDSLEATLEMAKDNRVELESVLDYYANANPDERKLEAAKFLISNMRYHTSPILIDRTIDPYLDSLVYTADSILFMNMLSVSPDSLYSKSFKKSLNEQQKVFKESISDLFLKKTIDFNLKTEYDCRILTSSQIINHIEYAFSSVDDSTFNKQADFDNFCEYVLPYRILPNYPLTDSIQQYSDLMSKYFAPIPKDSIVKIARRYNFIANELHKFFPRYTHAELIGLSGLHFRSSRDCILIDHLAATALRSLGIPSVMEYYAAHKLFRGRHYHVAVFDKDGNRFTYNPDTSLPTASNLNQRTEQNGTTLNIYRVMYSEQKETPFFMRNKDEYIPTQFNTPFLKDVTEGILLTTSLELPFADKTKNRFAYLASFSSEFPEGLVPVTWGEIDKGTHSVTFNTTVLERWYVPIYYNENKEIQSFGEPFFLDKDKNMHKLTSKESHITEIILTRKFVKKTKLEENARKMIGTVILGSNNSNFNFSDTIATIDYELEPYFQDINLNIKKGPYRYYRIQAPKEYPHTYYSEIQLLTDTAYKYINTCTPASLPILHPSQIEERTRANSITRLLNKPMEEIKKERIGDGDPTTGIGVITSAIDFSLNKPQYIHQIRLMPLNTDNGIIVGDRYQLYYWDNGKWNLAGDQIAEYNFLKFKVPFNTLYYLKNLSRGKEELPFVMNEAGEQEFIYSNIL